MRLYTKILLGVAAASLTAGHGIIVYSRKVVHEAHLSRIERAAELEARAVEGELAEAMLSGQEARMLPILQAYAKTLEGVSASALDVHGRVLSHTNVAEVGRVRSDAAALAALRSDAASSREERSRDARVLEVSIPIFSVLAPAAAEDFLLSGTARPARGARAGMLVAGLPLDETLATERQISGRILRVVLVLFGFTGLVLYFYMRRLLAPIGLLAAATEKIRAGDYRAAVPATSNDEIGSLGRSFNEMSRELERTTVSKDFFNDILDSIQDLVIVTDAAGLIVLVNPAVAAVLGWSREELIGRPGADLLAGTGVSFLEPSHNAAARFVAKSGEQPEVLFSSSAIKAADGTVTGYIGAAKDVTALRKIEARMQQSEKLSAVGQLAAGVAHEINNPLGVILGFAQAMARELGEGDALDLPIRSIEREALRCKALVQNLLTFARTSRGDRAPVDVNAAVERALALIAPHAKISRVAVATNLAPGLPPILGSTNQLEQVIMNLAKNAIDAMPGGGTLTVSSELSGRAPHSWIIVRCADDGAGIPAAILPRIFDPFFTTKAVGQGTGLGLSLVSEIVQKHSGEVSVESRPGRTAFTVRLPAAAPTPAAPPR